MIVDIALEIDDDQSGDMPSLMFKEKSDQEETLQQFHSKLFPDTQPGISVFDIFDNMPDIKRTQYQIYKLQRPNAGLHQTKYLNLEITSNMRITLPRLNQSENYDASAHNFWQINNSL